MLFTHGKDSDFFGLQCFSKRFVSAVDTVDWGTLLGSCVCLLWSLVCSTVSLSLHSFNLLTSTNP